MLQNVVRQVLLNPNVGQVSSWSPLNHFIQEAAGAPGIADVTRHHLPESTVETMYTEPRSRMRPIPIFPELPSTSPRSAGERGLAPAPDSSKSIWMSPFAGEGRRSDLIIDLAPLFRAVDLPELMRALDE